MNPSAAPNPARWRRLPGVLRALILQRRRYDPVLHWSPEQLRNHQEQSWRRVARFASAHSPFYRELYRGVDLARAPLTDLPPVDKQHLMERFDEAVTDAELRLRDIESFLAQASPEERFLSRFHVLQTSGSTGRRAVIVYSQEEWIHTIAAALCSQKLMGQRLRLWPKQRMATFISTNPFHISCRLTRSSDVGLLRRLTIDPQAPLESIARQLEDFQPEILFGYPSAILPLAQATVEGSLRIRPDRVIAGGETVSSTLRTAVQRAWSCPVLDLYATTETGAFAAESSDQQSRYLLEDTTLVEVVDENDRPLADGEAGHHLLITCLNRRAQPLVRYRLSDRVALGPPRGPGFPPFRCVLAIEGRVEDALRLKNQLGQEVEFRHPTLVENLLELTKARQIKVIQDNSGIAVRLVPPNGATAEMTAKVQRWFEATLAKHRLELPTLKISVVQRLVGDEATMGKYRPVECRLASRNDAGRSLGSPSGGVGQG